MDARTQHDIQRLEATLARLLDRHNQLLGLLQRKRDAMRAGDTHGMTELAQLEHEVVQQVSELEKARLEQVAQLTLGVRPDAAEPMKLGELAEALPEPERGRLLVSRQQLLEAMQRVQHETTVARRAAESLVKHVTGLIQTIGALSTGVSTYSSRGDAPGAQANLSTINLTA